MAEEKVLDFHAKCSEALDEILLHKNCPESRRNYIRRYVENLDINDELEVPKFEGDCEWFNVEHPLSFDGSLKGKVVILDFFTYCCINCMHILPDLAALEHRYKNTDGVAIVGVHSAKFDNEKLSANILSAVLRYDITHPVVNDAEAKLWHAMGIQCWPTLLIVNPHGRAIFILSGEGHRDILLDFVTEILQYYQKKGKISHNKLEMKLAKDGLKESILHFPGKITCRSDGKMLAIADTGHHRIIITDNNGIVDTCIGQSEPGFQDGCFTNCSFRSPNGICFSGNNVLYVADTENHAIRKIDMESGLVTTVAGTGHQGQDHKGGNLGIQQAINSPWDVVIADEYPRVLLIAMAGSHQIWTLFLSDASWIKSSSHKKGTCIQFAGSGSEQNRNNNYPHRAGFAQPSGLTTGKTSLDAEFSTVFVADSESSTIRSISLRDGTVKGIVGGDIDPLNLFAFGDVDGKATGARLQHPLGVSVVPQQEVLLVADSYNHKIKLVNPITRSSKTIAGSGQPGNGAGLRTNLHTNVLNEPGGLAVHPSGDKVYIADTNNHCIKQLNMSSMELSELPIIFVKDSIDSGKAKNKKAMMRLCPLTTDKIELDPIKVTRGQELEIMLCIDMPAGSSINPEAPCTWSLHTEDAELRLALGDHISGPLKGPKVCDLHLLTFSVPQYSSTCVVNIQAECSLILCGTEETCFLRSCIIIQPLQIDITENNSPSETAVIKLTHQI